VLIVDFEMVVPVHRVRSHCISTDAVLSRGIISSHEKICMDDFMHE
jgi:hypothetical protein